MAQWGLLVLIVITRTWVWIPRTKLNLAAGTYNPIPEGQGAETGEFPRLDGHSP